MVAASRLWFTFNLAVHFRPKMALTLEIFSDSEMHTLPRDSAGHTLFLFFASFRGSKSALCHLPCQATCSLRTDKQLGNNVASAYEYSKTVTAQQLGDRITGGPIQSVCVAYSYFIVHQVFNKNSTRADKIPPGSSEFFTREANDFTNGQ